MAEESWLLTEDGYLKVETDVKEIVYHPSLNVILICTNNGIVRVLDVNSGVILQSTDLSAQNGSQIKCKYIPREDRILFCDGQAIGARTDYNGVLLLDSILQKVVTDLSENVKLEILLTEACILRQSFKTVTFFSNLEFISNLIENAITAAQQSQKKGIKAQKWNTACLSLPAGDFKNFISTVVYDFISKKNHAPELQVASAVNERLSELLGEPTHTIDKKMMASEIRRRETFSQWPHMDYKWALPEQMAQAGFYHQPNSAGDDRAMCFTCTVCLVSWERTDEPWSEHERHSPSCPFVVGEYTQNVPISVTNATAPAIDAAFRGVNINVLGSSSIPKLLPTCTQDGLISVFDISGKIKRTHSFFVTQFDSHILEKFTIDFGVPVFGVDEKKKAIDKQVTALSIVNAVPSILRPRLIAGISISQEQNASSSNEGTSSSSMNNTTYMGHIKRCNYLVVYDFMYSKENDDKDVKSDVKKNENNFSTSTQNKFGEQGIDLDQFNNMFDTMSPDELGNSLFTLSSFYQSLIPGDSDTMFLPPEELENSKKNHTGPRLLSLDMQNAEAELNSDLSSNDIILGYLPNGSINSSDQNESSSNTISDHINDIKKNQSNKKLNYSKAMQCVALPSDIYKCRQYAGNDLEIISIIPTLDETHILVTLCSKNSNESYLLLYSLDCSNYTVKINEKSVILRKLVDVEKPIEVNMLPVLDKFKATNVKMLNNIKGNAILVCVDGAVRIVDLATLRTTCLAKIDDQKFVSAAYCNSLDRLCASTTEGSLHFFALNDIDNESVDDHEEEDILGIAGDNNTLKEYPSLEKLEIAKCFKEPPNVISLDDLKSLQKLISFTPVRFIYNVVVPTCWSEFQQAMRQRRNTAIINTDAFIKTWRLQTDTTTWEEHIFEITLPTAMVLGHVDVHFTLQNGCTKPCVEISLLRQTKSGIGHNKDVKFSVDDTVTIDMLRRVENPVISEEYLRAHNADILAGPVNIANYLDLSEQSGTVNLTSPRMFKLKVRNLLLHIRAVYDKDDKKLRTDKGNLINVDKFFLPKKSEQYLGCDSIHELSIGIYTPSNNMQVSHEKALRNHMLDSNVFVQSLIATIINSDNREIIKNVLDILLWVASIRLVPNKTNNGEAPNDQLEFIYINGIEENITGLLRQCLLYGCRSVAHKCMNYIITCCSGAENISKTIGDHFNNVVLYSLLQILDQIKEVKSAAGLHWLLALLQKVIKKDSEGILKKCVLLLKDVSNDLMKKSNPYHLLLRSRYGLYGLATEPELFDLEPPSFAKGSSTASVPLQYIFSSTNNPNNAVASSSVASTNKMFIPAAEFASKLGQQIPSKETTSSSSPRETSPADNKIKYRNVAFPKLIKGLIETEPLHFSCINTSEGTRLEMNDLITANNVQSTMPNHMPFLPPMSDQSINFNNKKIDLYYVIQKSLEKFNVELNNIMTNYHQTEMKNQFSEGTSQEKNIFYQQHQYDSSASFPWQQLLISPPKQVVVVERMHSGAKRHVILDFGDSVSLTDILIPTCSDLVSLTIDVWLFGEEIDPVRLVTAGDIGTKNLLLNDLQPPPLCRYMKITLLGRYGMSTTRCRIPLGYFYGHVVVLPEEIPTDVQIKPISYEKNLNVLTKLLEDISCRYSLACSKLKDYLQPFLVADLKNTLHLSTYISILKDKSLNVTNTENSKIFTAYQETLTYQHQLNIIRNVKTRIENSISSEKNVPLPAVSSLNTDKLISIAENLLEVILSIDGTIEVNKELCQHFFNALCVSQPSRLQLLSAVFLEKSCGMKNFWGNFLADSLLQLFSTSCTTIFPQDRLFVLLIYLSRKSPERSAIIDAAMRVVYNTLKPIENTRSLLLAVNIDLPLLSWLLLYLSLQLSFGKEETDRWDWVLGEMAGKVNGKNNGRRKNVKRVAPTFGPTGFVSNCPTLSKSYTLSTPIKDYYDAAKAGKTCPIKCVIVNNEQKDKNDEEHKDPTSLKDLMMLPQKVPQFIDTDHCLAVAKILIKFIVTMDHSGSADMMLLAFKIISKLVTMAKLQLSQLISETQLLELINFSLACKVPWAPFALSCFLQDALDLQKESDSEVIEMDIDASTSSIWASNNHNADLTNNTTSENAEESAEFFINLDEAEQIKTKFKLMNPHPFSLLPSVFETDSNDSDFEESLSDIHREKIEVVPKTTKFSSISTTIDARLESGVYAASEISLRKLTIKNTQKLLQNISQDKSKEIENPLLYWSGENFGQFQAESTLNNLSMLSYSFNDLFKNMAAMNPDKIENILHLWLTLNCARKDEKFDSSAMPIVHINADSIGALIGTLAWTSGLTLTSWCLGLQALTLVCNIINTAENDWIGLSGMAGVIVNHQSFTQLFISLLSGNGSSFIAKGAAGPTLCKALHDFLVRLQVRCDIVSPSSKLGNLFKSVLLNVVYQLSRPGGPIATRTGPLDAQCKLLQSILYLDFTNIDISIGMSTLESTAVLLNSYFMNIDNIKCVTMWEKQCVIPNNYGDIFASVLGTDSNKQNRPVSYEDLLITLLKLLGKLVQTPINNINPIPMELGEPSTSSSSVSQTDESKAEQIHQNENSTTFLADTVLQHFPTIISLLKCLAACKSSSLCMLTNLSQKNFTNLAEPNTVGDAVFHILTSLARKAARKELIMEPLLMFLSQASQLSEPLIWFVLQVLENEDSINAFHASGGIQILASSIVSSSNTPSSISKNGTISTVMQHFTGLNYPNDVGGMTPLHGTSKATHSTSIENNLVNFAPYSTITCQSVTSQPADVLIQGVSLVTHRRARAPLWSYNYYPEETHTELLLQLPNAVLLKEVQLQPHAGGLATCPSFVAIETSANGPSRLVPACHPLPTSGLTSIRLHLPTPKVVNCVLIRLYKPRVGNSIGLLQIKLLGSYAFGRTSTGSSSTIENEDDFYCNHSLGWLRLLHHCFTNSINQDLKHTVVESASQVSNLLNTCCGLLLVPSHILPVYLPCLEKVLIELALLTPENGIETIKILLDNRLSIVEPMMSLDYLWQDRLMVNVPGYQSACELLFQICEHQDPHTEQRVKMILDWLQLTAEECLEIDDTSKCSTAYISSIASILWSSKQSSINYDLKALISLELFELIYNVKMKTTSSSLKYSLDSLLCSLCYIRSEFFPILLEKIGILVPNLSTDLGASISDDRKDTSTSRLMSVIKDDEEWYSHLIIGELNDLNLTKEELETVALASRSPTAIQQLLDSGLPKLLNNAIIEFCNQINEQSTIPMAKLEKVTAILKFFTEVCDEKTLRDWLGSPDGSTFWPYLLHWLCKRPFIIQSEAHVHLEEICVKFLTKCCLCHPVNQTRLATVLCEVIELQQNGISGFLRRLILQLLLENEKVPVSIEADETFYKTSKVSSVYLPTHPAFKQTYNRTLLYLSTTTTLGDILEQHLFFNTIYKSNSTASKKPAANLKKDIMHLKDFFVTDFSDLSVAAGVTAKDKRVKDIKNFVIANPSSSTPQQSKKKRYNLETVGINSDVMEGRLIKCLAFPEEPLPLNLNLGQLLRLMETENCTNNNWPYIHLTICQQSKAKDEKLTNKDGNLIQEQPPICSALQVFSSMGGLALLAQNLPTVYPEAVRVSTQEKSVSDLSDSDWIKLDEPDDIYIYEDIEETVGSCTPSKTNGGISHIPPHSLTAFSLFLRLPGYAEVLLKDTRKALCLLRLMLGVTDDGEGGDIFQSAVASSLPTLPFEVLQKLYDTSPLCSDDGRLLRRISLTTGVVQLLLACLGVLTHSCSNSEKEQQQKDLKNKDDRQLYWAKGTGFGTGSTQQSWNVEQALMKQKNEEEHVTVLLQVLASYINPNDGTGEELSGNVLPSQFPDLLAKSSLLNAISSYLRNDSVLDMARHIPLYKAVLKVLRALALSTQLVKLLLPQKFLYLQPSVGSLLKNMKFCVDIYANKLKVQSVKAEKIPVKASKSNSLLEKIDDVDQGEGLATLMPDIQNTANLVAKVTCGMEDETDSDKGNALDLRVIVSSEEQYMKIMKDLQFAAFDMIEEQPDGSLKFVVSHHYESVVKSAAEQAHPVRVKRIAQETVTLSTSLPLSYSSSVFVRYDSSRLDIMKVLITGPADTPYANGCFELDVFFPPDYPSSPMLINLETTGHHTVRFNPNLYNDGKVCLSVLNTWHGRPEEKWNAQTSSFLQVLVSIQSLILVPEPYFNEPGYERARGTPAGTANSKDYNFNICQATVRWAMLDQILNPCPCFKDVINAHFYMKRKEILSQIEKWIEELEQESKKEKKNSRVTKKNRTATLENFKKIYKQLQEELAKLTPPADLIEEIPTISEIIQHENEEEDDESAKTPTNINLMQLPLSELVSSNQLNLDQDLEKMVDDLCNSN